MKAYASVPEVLLHLSESQIALAEAISIFIMQGVASNSNKAINDINHCLSFINLNQLRIIESIEKLSLR